MGIISHQLIYIGLSYGGAILVSLALEKTKKLKKHKLHFVGTILTSFLSFIVLFSSSYYFFDSQLVEQKRRSLQNIQSQIKTHNLEALIKKDGHLRSPRRLVGIDLLQVFPKNKKEKSYLEVCMNLSSEDFYNLGVRKMSPIIPIIIFFFLSLIGAFILFNFLKSSAALTPPSDNIPPSKKIPGSTPLLGGSLAGFFVIFGLLMGSYHFSSNSIPLDEHLETIALIKCIWEPQEWTIYGNISKEDLTSLEGTNISYLPPTPHQKVDNEKKSFAMTRVRISPFIGFPNFQFHCAGYMPEEYKIDFNRDQIDCLKRTIRLKEEIILIKYDNKYAKLEKK